MCRFTYSVFLYLWIAIVVVQCRSISNRIRAVRQSGGFDIGSLDPRTLTQMLSSAQPETLNRVFSQLDPDTMNVVADKVQPEGRAAIAAKLQPNTQRNILGQIGEEQAEKLGVTQETLTAASAPQTLSKDAVVGQLVGSPQNIQPVNYINRGNPFSAHSTNPYVQNPFLASPLLASYRYPVVPAFGLGYDNSDTVDIGGTFGFVPPNPFEAPTSFGGDLAIRNPSNFNLGTAGSTRFMRPEDIWAKQLAGKYPATIG